MSYRNGYMLAGKLASRGYDWWWHSLVEISKRTGEKRPFFLEYFVINPALGGKDPIFGQLGVWQRLVKFLLPYPLQSFATQGLQVFTIQIFLRSSS